MKYIIIGFTVALSISWQMLQTNSEKRNQHPQIQINGKVHGLKGNMVLNIQDNYLTLSSLDRFSLLVQADQDKVTMWVIDKPQDQQCEIIKSKQSNNAIRLNIYCKMVETVSLNSTLSMLKTII